MLGPIKRRQSRASNRRSAISTRIRLAGVDQRQLDLYPPTCSDDKTLMASWINCLPVASMSKATRSASASGAIGVRLGGNLDRNGLLLGLAARADQRNLLLATAVAVARMRGSPNRLKTLGLRRSMLRRRGVRPTAQANAWLIRRGSLRVEAPHGGRCAHGKDCQKDRSCDCFHG